jgi:hypothetical protein
MRKHATSWGSAEDVELSAPVVTTADNVDPTYTQQAPPQDDHLVADIAAILIAGYALKQTIDAIVNLLTPYGYLKEAISAAVSLSDSGTNAMPNLRLGKNGVQDASAALRAIRRQEVYYRAAYVLNASRRIQAGLDQGKPLRVIIGRESDYYRQHEAARRGRLNSAAKVQKAASDFGPLLGWYHNPMLNNEIECLTASGHNFYADEGTMIGLPGSVHQNCGCTAGPPIPGAGMVNDALALLLKRSSGKRAFKIKRKVS